MSYRSQITLDIGADGTFCTDQEVDFTLDWNGFPDEGTTIVNYNLSFTEYNASDTFLLICGMNYTITASGFYSQWDEDFCTSPNPGLLHYRDNEYGYNNGVIESNSIPNRMISPYGLLQPNETSPQTNGTYTYTFIAGEEGIGFYFIQDTQLGDNCGSVQFNIVTSPPSFTYLWNFGDGNTLTTTSNTPPSHTYSSPGKYHVTCTATPWLSNHNATNNFGEDCVFFDEFDIVVGQSANINISSSPNTLCQGQIASLNATGASNYLWNTGETTSSITVSPNTTQTYTVTGYLDPNCPTQANKTVYVHPTPSLDLSLSTSPLLCPGQSLTLFANSNATSFVWTANNSVISNSQLITVTPSLNTTYTVIASFGQCSATQSLNVDVNPCNCGTLIGTNETINSNYSNNVYRINNNVSVSGNIELSDAEILLNTNNSITIPNGSKLTLRNVLIHSCSSSMWEGIIVQNGGELTTTSNSNSKQTLIEDAKIAIKLEQANYGPCTSKIQIDKTIFNKNNKALYLYNIGSGSLVSNFKFENNVVTCRDINYVLGSNTWNVTSIRNPYYPTTNPHSDQYINENNYSSSNLEAFLKIPYANKKPELGIQLYNVRGGSSITIGNVSKFNIFDNLYRSIYSVNSNVTIMTNKFQNSIYPQDNLIVPTAIYLQHTDNTFVTGATIKQNLFVNVHQVLYASNLERLTILENELRSNAIEQNSPTTSSHRGKMGLNIISKKFQIYNIKDNLIYNIENGINFFGTYGLINGTNQQILGELRIQNNTIKRSMNTNSYSGRVRNAISIINLFAPLPVTNTNMSYSKILVLNNTIQDVYRGIKISGFRQRKILIDNGDQASSIPPAMTFVQSPVTNDLCFGVQFTNNLNSADSKHIIKNVKINGFGTTYTRSYGIYTEMSERTKIACNYLKDTYHGLYFKGSNPVMETANNSLEGNKYGFTLDAQAIIGQQGSEDYTTGNKWIGTWTVPRYKTATLNYSSAQNSKMYVKSPGIEDPNGSGFVDLTGTPNLTNYFTDGTQNPNNTIIFDASNSKNCATDFNLAMQPQNPNEIRIIQEKDHFRRIINHEVIFEMNPSEKEHIAKQQIYTVLRLNPELMANEPVLEAFFNEHEQGNIGKIDRIEQALEEDNFTLAIEENNTLVPENAIEQSYKRYNEILLAFINEQYTETDNTDLFAIANGCPQIDGAVVFSARALYENLNGHDFIIEGECLEENRGAANKMAFGNGNKTEKEIKDDFSKSEVLIYPNPSKDKFFITAINIKEAKVTIFDQQGRVIIPNIEIIHDNLLEFSNNLSIGLYVICIEKMNEKIIRKIIIE